MNEDRAARYHRLRRRAALASAVAGVALLVALYSGGWSAALAAWAERQGSALPRPAGRLAAIVLFTGAIALGWEVLSLPFVFYRSFLLDRKYGLSSEPLRTWIGDHLKALALGLALTLAGAVALYAAMRLSPAFWWAIGAALFAAAAVAISQLAPVLLMPLFYSFRPLEQEALRRRLLTLSTRAGVPVLGAFEWGLGEKTTRANAALVGAGRTRRILVSDTLIKDYSEDEIEVVLAHELAHHIHHDIWTALALETFVVGLVLLAADLVVRHAAASAGVRSPSDLAALPLMLLTGGLVSLLLAPLTNAWSRHNERRADRFALTLTGRRAAFVTAMRRLGQQNLAEERPSRLIFLFFYTHPTIEQRIAAAKTFTPV